MSETITVSDPNSLTRTPRPPPGTSVVDGAPKMTIDVETVEHAGPTPEEALADMQRAVADKDRQLDEAKQARTRAEREAARAHAGRAVDRGAAVAGQLEAAKSEKDRAKAAKKAARESGDLEAEIAADEAFNAASFREMSASAELAALKADPTSAAGRTTEPSQRGGYSPQAQSWIDNHPRFNSDTSYKGTILRAHEQAVQDGIVEGSPAYFRELDRVAATMEQQNGGGNSRTEERGGTMPNGFQGAPPARGGSTGRGQGSGWEQTLLGPVQVSERADGKVQLKVPPELHADFVEGAKITGMDLGDYIYEQVQIARERRSGGTGSLTIQEGVTYR